MFFIAGACKFLNRFCEKNLALRLRFFGIFPLAVLVFLSSCVFQKKPRLPSFLIVAVDSLGFDSVSCYQDDISIPRSGFNLLCGSSVRFHHAYTPSVLVQPALASLLTGLYPYEHGVWSNGSHFLSSQFKTLPEEALKKGYRSSFFSGGGAVWRKSGLSQGFEVFDDNIQLSYQRIYRPARENIQLFLQWLDQIGRRQPFFSILYLPDLQFSLPDLGKKVGDLQSLKLGSRKNVLDSAVYYLIQELKKRKKWHSTYFILFGTKGQEKYQSVRQNEVSPWSLFSDNTQISLFIKGLSKYRKKARYGNINTPVTLVDLGWTLFDLLNSLMLEKKKTALSQKKLFPPLSLKHYVFGGELSRRVKNNFEFQPGWKSLSLNRKDRFVRPSPTDMQSERALLIESGWPLWRKVGFSRFAVRKGPYFFIYDEKPLIYDSLTDRQELNPLSSPGSHPNLQTLKDNFLFYFKQMGVQPWKAPDLLFTEKLRLGKRLFSLSPFQSSLEVQDQLRVLMKKDPSNPDLMDWRAELALRNKQWKVLKSLGKKRKNFYWQYVARRNLSERWDEQAETACEKLFEKTESANCENKSLLSLYKWIQNKDEKKSKKIQARFFYFYLKEKRDQKISRMNQRAYLVWDTYFSQFQEPLLSDLFLHLPEHKKYLKMVMDAL